MGLPEHSKIINSIARKILKPIGLVQKGNSRTWLDDHGWYTIIVEFQPYSYRQGTFLNVGANFHWRKEDYWSFDIGHRESDFVNFENAEQFTTEFENLAGFALDKILFYRKALSNINAAKDTILNHKFTSEELWGSYHKGIICGLTNDLTELHKYFDKLLAFEDRAPFIPEVKSEVTRLKVIALDPNSFKEEIRQIIKRTREAKRLPSIETDAF